MKQNYEEIIEQLDGVSNWNEKVGLTLQLPDEYKVKALGKFETEFQKALVIQTIESKDIRLHFLKQLNDQEAKAFIIRTFDDTEKIKYLIEEINDDRARATVVFTMENPQLQALAIEQIHAPLWKADAASSIKDNRMKLQYLDQFNDLFLKYHILTNFEIMSSEEIINNLDVINDEISKAVAITFIQDEEIKKQKSEGLSSEKAKAIVLSSIKDNEYKKDKISTITDRKSRALVIASLNEIKDKEEYADDINKYSGLELDDDVTAGIEIENEGEFAAVLYNISDIIKGWRADQDNSLECGVEIVSTILQNNDYDVKSIYHVCKDLNDCGQVASPASGGHVHIGAKKLESKQAYINFLQLWCNTEDLMYLICNKAGEMPREGQIEYATPISKKIAEAIKDGKLDLAETTSKEEFIEQLKQVQETRYFAVNFQNINNENKNTIEFRIANGTIDPNKWIENISLFGGMVQVSQKIAELQEKDEIELTENEKNLLNIFEIIQTGQSTEKQRLDALLSLTLSSEEKRSVFLETYRVNSELAKTSENYSNLKTMISPVILNTERKTPYVIHTHQIGKKTINQPTTSKREVASIENDEIRLSSLDTKEQKGHN